MVAIVILATAVAVTAAEPPLTPPHGPERRLEECWKLATAHPTKALDFVAAELTKPLRRKGSEAATAELRLCSGYAYEQRGDFGRAAAIYQRGVEESERLGDQKLFASALTLRGELAYYRGDFTAALDDLDRAYRLEVELGRKRAQNRLLNAIANVYADPRVAAYDRAIEYYRQVLASHRRDGDLQEQATAHFNLASTLERKGDLGAALKELERSLTLDRERGDADEVAVDQRALAALLVKLGRANDALPLVEHAVAHFDAAEDQASLAQARLTRGIARRHTGDLDGALLDLDDAARHFRSEQNARYLERVEAERAEALATKGDFAGAFRARTAQVELERKLAEVMREEHTSRLRVQFDADRKEAENLALARVRSLQRVVIALAALLLVLLVALVLRQLRHARNLRFLAMTDELTRLPNRRALFGLAEQELAIARRAGAPLSLLALDIDHFKRINDAHGHEAGDRVLQRVAHAARSALRRGDTLGRIGGEEFMVVLPQADLATAAEVAERLRTGVAAIDASDLGQDLRITTSIGIAMRRPDDTALDTLARRADEALYRAKERGRNRVELADDESSPSSKPSPKTATAAQRQTASPAPR